MKTMNLTIVAATAWAAASASSGAAPVIEEKDLSEKFTVGAAPALTIDNIWGDVTVRRGADNRIELAIRSVRRASDQKSFERSLRQIPLHIEQDGDEVYLVVGDDHDRWWERPRCRGCELRLDIVATVPEDTTLQVSTVNDGHVTISGVRGRINAENVNGSIRVDGLVRCDDIETINGDIDLRFAASPASDCRVETLNGDIELALTPNANADLGVALFNGSMRSALDLSPLAMRATVERTSDDGRLRYEIEQLAGLRLGRGGNVLTLKSLNGDVLVARSQ